jgi:D-alanyl-lipoteichoic acid acyltransferase DltB (MBOAT superfamily)
MQFSDLTFWSLFTGFFILYWFVHKHITARNILLLLGSFGFYLLWDARFFWLLLVAIVFTYLIALRLHTSKYRTFLLWLGIFVCIGTLLYFKYYNFFIASLSPLLPLLGLRPDSVSLQILLPLGISFYIFQILSYLIDVYRGTIPPERNFLHYALLISFFPKLASGPIEKPGPLLEQFKTERPLTSKTFSDGIYLLVWGGIQKYVIADNAALIAKGLFTSPAETTFFVGILALSLQIYADFSGYSDMAKGLASLLGFELSWNFRMPYLSSTPSDFWKRWHITLSQWFQQYVYIPLGGSRCSNPRIAMNLLITMGLCGLWHGARWTFVIWGLYHGFLLIAYRFGANLFYPGSRFIQRMNETGLAILLFFALTSIGWIFFQSPTLNDALRVFTQSSYTLLDPALLLVALLWLPIVLMHMLQLYYADLLAFARFSLGKQLIFYFAAYYVLLYLPPLVPQQFIYVQF